MTSPAQQLFDSAKKNYAEAKKQLAAAARTHFEEGAAGLFQKHPEMANFSWTQYTPYWCDGDPCEFGANTGYPEINGDEVSESTWNKGKSTPSKDPLVPAAKAVKEFLKQFTDDDYEDMFGDHVKVTVTPAGVDTEEYEHE